MIGNVVVGNSRSIPIRSSAIAFHKLFEKAGESTVVYLEIDGEPTPRPTLIDEVSYHPVTNQLQHVVFRQVDLKQKVQAEISLEQVGEFNVPEAVLVTVRDSIEVEALPTDLPEKLDVDLSQLTTIGQSITVADLKIDHRKVTVILAEDMDPAATPVVIVQEQRQAEEVATAAVEEPGEGESEGPSSTDQQAELPAE